MEGAWSAAEVVAHLITVERAVVGAAERIVQKEPKKVSVFRRFHMPFVVVERRLVRRKSPIPLNDKLLGEKGTMLADLREARAGTVALMEATKSRELSVYRWPHPFLGYLTAYEWFLFLGSHQIRHGKQLLEIAQRLPKAISDLQK